MYIYKLYIYIYIYIYVYLGDIWGGIWSDLVEYLSLKNSPVLLNIWEMDFTKVTSWTHHEYIACGEK